MQPTIKDKLQKIYELSRRGATDGERQAAASILMKLLLKHSLSLDDLVTEEKVRVWLPCRSKLEQKLALQIVGTVTNQNSAITVYYREGKPELGIDATPVNAIQIKEMFAHHARAYRQQIEDMMNDFVVAYINANHIFPSSAADDDDRELTPEEMQKLYAIAAMAQSIQPKPMPYAKLPKSTKGN